MPLDFSLDETQQQVVERVREAFAPFRGWYERSRSDELFEPSWEALARAGFLAAAVPPAHGGTGGGLLPLCLMIEELGAAGLPSMLPILTAIDAFAIGRHGGESLRARLLPRLATGAVKLCLAVTEVEAGFNTFRIRTRATRQEDAYVVSGAKIYTSGADVAEAMLLLTRTIPLEECAAQGLPKTAGLSWFVVDTKARGVRLTQVPTRGEGTLKQFAVELDRVEVPAEDLVGAEGEGTAVLLDLINPERMLVAAMLIGVAQHCLDVASAHARTRRVFDDVIGRYQSVQHPLAEVKIRQEAARLMTWKAATALDGGGRPKEVSHYGNAAKFLAAELAHKGLAAALNALGGKGFDERYGVVHLLEVVELLQVAPIGKGLILNQVAENALGLPRSY